MQEAVVTPSIHAVSRDGARFIVIVIALLLIFKTELINLCLLYTSFLPYLPDQKLAMEFDKVRDKTELVWDFSVKASEKMKQQILSLIHI